MVTGAIFWGLCFVQTFLQVLRKGELAWIHRRCGQGVLILWFVSVGPTAAYLSLYCSPGPSQVAMAGFSIISLETTLYASYFLWRGWLVALRKKRGADSLALHGKAMRVGIILSMSILWQRPVQFAVICVRKVLLVMLPYVSDAVADVTANVLDHHVILSLTTCFPYAFLFTCMLDGPRSIFVVKVMGLNNLEYEELFGSPYPCLPELLFWLCRVPFLVGLRWYVTSGWTADPLAQVTTSEESSTTELQKLAVSAVSAKMAESSISFVAAGALGSARAVVAAIATTAAIPATLAESTLA